MKCQIVQFRAGNGEPLLHLSKLFVNKCGPENFKCCDRNHSSIAQLKQVVLYLNTTHIKFNFLGGVNKDESLLNFSLI